MQYFTVGSEEKELGFSPYSLTIQLSKNKRFTSRVVYEIFGFLSTIGGFQGTILSLVTLFMGFYNSCSAYYTIVSQLYVVGKRVQKKSQLLENIEQQSSYTLGD